MSRKCHDFCFQLAGDNVVVLDPTRSVGLGIHDGSISPLTLQEMKAAKMARAQEKASANSNDQVGLQTFTYIYLISNFIFL